MTYSPGSHFVHALLESEPEAEVVNLDLLTYAANPLNLRPLESEPNYHFVRGDIGDRTLLRSLLQTHRDPKR